MLGIGGLDIDRYVTILTCTTPCVIIDCKCSCKPPELRMNYMYTKVDMVYYGCIMIMGVGWERNNFYRRQLCIVYKWAMAKAI